MRTISSVTDRSFDTNTCTTVSKPDVFIFLETSSMAGELGPRQ